MRYKSNIFLSIIFIAMSFFLLFSIHSIEKSLKLQLDENVFLGDNSLNFTITCDNGEKVDNKIISLDNQYVVMRDDLGGYKQYAIYFKGKLNKEPKMIKGRFFYEDDFNKNNKLAVIGKNLKDEIIVKNGENYYYIENEYYKVIGIMGDRKEETSCDSSVYINLDSLIKDNTSFYLQGHYILQSKGENEEIFQDVKNIYENKNVIVREKISENQSPISKILNKIDVYSIENIIKVIIVLILNISLTTIYWIKRKSRIIGIKRAMGATKNRISLEILKELSTVSIISFFIGYLSYLFITYIRDGYVKFYFVTMLAVLGITIITTLIAAGISIYNINKMEPSKIMRCC